MPYTAPTDASPKLQAFATFLTALLDVDIPTVSSYFDDALEAEVLPKTLGIPKMGKDAYAAFLAGGFASFFEPGALDLTVHNLVESSDSITVYLQNEGTSKLGSAWKQECIIIAHFTPALKIVKYFEFVDTAVIKEWMGAEGKKRAEVAAQ